MSENQQKKARAARIKAIKVLVVLAIFSGLLWLDSYEPPEPEIVPYATADSCFAKKTCAYCTLENKCPEDKCLLIQRCRSSALRLNPFDLGNDCKVSGYQCMSKQKWESQSKSES